MPTAIDEIVRTLAAKHLDVPLAEIDLDGPLSETVDSIGLSILVVALEQRFGVAFEDRAVAKARSLRDLVRLVESRAGS